MATVLAVMELEHVSGLPEDRIVNTFPWLTPSVGVVETELDTIAVALNAFYNTQPTGASGEVNQYLSPAVKRGSLAATLKVYDLTGHLDGTAHGSPVKTYGIDLDAAGAADPLPSELSLCITTKNLYGADPEFSGLTRPRARDRGRVYIGPLNVNANSATTARVSRPSAAVLDVFGKAATDLMNVVGGAWAVWSRKKASLEPVIGGWVDNSFDVQRRRGEAPTARTFWGAP